MYIYVHIIYISYVCGQSRNKHQTSANLVSPYINNLVYY